MITKTFRGMELPLLGMGNMRLPVQEAAAGMPIDAEKAQEMIDYAMAHGVNYYDTAYIYHNGESERFLGDALVSRYPRDSFYIATKYPIFVSTDYAAVFTEQLARLKTDYIDFYLIHAVSDRNCQPLLDSGAIEYFQEQKRQGHIKYLGFSCHASPENTAKFAGSHPWDFAQLQLNYFDWDFGIAKGQYDAIAKYNLPIIVMEPLHGGRLAALTNDTEALLREVHPDWTMAQWALRWLEQFDLVQVILSGMSTLEQMQQNVATLSQSRPLTNAEIQTLKRACAAFREQVQVPCTACRYCCEGCAAQIDIPAIIEVYNHYKIDGAFALGGLEETGSAGAPADCIACGACSANCPQNIQISGIMQELAALK